MEMSVESSTSQLNTDIKIEEEDYFSPLNESQQNSDEDDDHPDDLHDSNLVGCGLVKWGATRENMYAQLIENGINVDPDFIVRLKRTEFMDLRNNNGYTDAQKSLLSEVRRILRLRVNEAKRRHERKTAREHGDILQFEHEKEDIDEDIISKIGEHKPLTKEDMQKIIEKTGLDISIDKLNEMTGWEFRKFKAMCNDEQALVLGKFKRRLSAQKYSKRKKLLETGELPEKKSKLYEDPQPGPSDPSDDPIDIENKKLTNEEMQEVLTRSGLTITVEKLSEMDKKEYQLVKAGLEESQASILGKIRNRLIMRNWWKKKKVKSMEKNSELNFTNMNPNTLLELFNNFAQIQNKIQDIVKEELPSEKPNID